MAYINFAMPRRTLRDAATGIHYIAIICCSRYPWINSTGDSSFSFWNSSHVYLNHYQPLYCKHISNNNHIQSGSQHSDLSMLTLLCKLLYSRVILAGSDDWFVRNYLNRSNICLSHSKIVINKFIKHTVALHWYLSLL